MRVFQAEAPWTNQKLFVMVWVSAEVVELDGDADEPRLDVLAVPKILLSDAMDRKEVATEVQGQRQDGGWLPRQVHNSPYFSVSHNYYSTSSDHRGRGQGGHAPAAQHAGGQVRQDPTVSMTQ